MMFFFFGRYPTWGQLHRCAGPAQMLNTALASVGHSSAPLLLTLYDQALTSHPLETRVATAASLAFAGDAVAQWFAIWPIESLPLCH